MKTRVFISIGFLVSTFLSFGQNNFTGVVSDEEGKLLEGVKVCIQATTFCTQTDAQGKFSLGPVIGGQNTLVFECPGYTSSANFFYTEDFNVPLKIMLYKSTQTLEEVQVTSTRASAASSSAIFVEEKTLEKKAFGQDLPFLVDGTPSLVTTSDAGNGVGYTGMRIRGIDASRINVTLNGIPINDPESHDVYWVNMPDLSSSIENIQIQRGIGSSTNGAAAFGAGLNLKSSNLSETPYATIDNSYGAFNTLKNSIKIGTGLLHQKFNFETRLSRISSDGFLDRAKSNLNSIYFSGAYLGKNFLLKALVFSGHELTYQAWYGTPESRLTGDVAEMSAYADRNLLSPEERQNLISSGRTYNFYTYKNQVDNYKQDNYQLHYAYSIKSNLLLNISGHYTYGRGYYEEYKNNQTLSGYGMSSVVVGNDTLTTSDLIRQRWLNNDFVGSVFSLSYFKHRLNVVWGGSVNTYLGRHYGEVIWSRFASDSELGDRYYNESGQKSEWSSYVKGSYKLKDWTFNGDIQFRHLDYSFLGVDQVSGVLKDVQQRVKFNFLNPKISISRQLSYAQSIFASFGISHREPVRKDFRESTPNSRPKAEILRDVELGYTYKKSKLLLNVNAYFMDYTNQLILTGEINDVGSYTRTNVPSSYRLGIEMNTAYAPFSFLKFNGALALSQNKIKEFNEFLDVYSSTEPYYSQQIITHKDVDLAFSPNVVASLGVVWEPFKNMNVEWMSKFVSQQFLDNTAALDRSIKAFSYSNLTLNYALRHVLGKEINFGLQVNNIFNYLYANNGYTFSYLYDGQKTTENFYYPQAGRNLMCRVLFKF